MPVALCFRHLAVKQRLVRRRTGREFGDGIVVHRPHGLVEFAQIGGTRDVDDTRRGSSSRELAAVPKATPQH
jgi:hypothetical protein